MPKMQSGGERTKKHSYCGKTESERTSPMSKVLPKNKLNPQLNKKMSEMRTLPKLRLQAREQVAPPIKQEEDQVYVSHICPVS
jgi:hypothetical protein